MFVQSKIAQNKDNLISEASFTCLILSRSQIVVVVNSL